MESANINEHKAEVLKWSMSTQRQKWRQIYSYLLWMLLSALRLNDHRHKTLLRSDLFRYMQRILIIRDLKHFFYWKHSIVSISCLLSLRDGEKVKSACWLTGNVGDHDEDEEGVVIKGEVVLVGQSDRVQACLLHVRQRCIDSQQFPGHSHGIQHNEEGVPTAEGFVKDKTGRK